MGWEEGEVLRTQCIVRSRETCIFKVSINRNQPILLRAVLVLRNTTDGYRLLVCANPAAARRRVCECMCARVCARARARVYVRVGTCVRHNTTRAAPSVLMRHHAIIDSLVVHSRVVQVSAIYFYRLSPYLLGIVTIVLETYREHIRIQAFRRLEYKHTMFRQGRMLAKSVDRLSRRSLLVCRIQLYFEGWHSKRYKGR